MTFKYLMLGAGIAFLIIAVILVLTFIFGLLWAASFVTLIEYAVASAQGRSIDPLSEFIHHIVSQPLDLAILGFLVLIPFTILLGRGGGRGR